MTPRQKRCTAPTGASNTRVTLPKSSVNKRDARGGVVLLGDLHDVTETGRVNIGNGLDSARCGEFNFDVVAEAYQHRIFR